MDTIIEVISDRAEVSAFAAKRRTDSPMLVTDGQFEHNIINADLVLAAYSGGGICGVFSFSVLPDDRYIECLAALTESSEAVIQAVEYLKQHYSGFTTDWVLSPKNSVAKALIGLGATAYPPLLGFEAKGGRSDLPESPNIHPLTPAEQERYISIHAEDCYWTAERVIASGRFTVLLAEGANGYIDVFTASGGAEVYSLSGSDSETKKALLAEALRTIDKDIFMMLEDSEQEEIRIAEELGFKRKPETDNLTLHLNL